MTVFPESQKGIMKFSYKDAGFAMAVVAFAIVHLYTTFIMDSIEPRNDTGQLQVLSPVS